MFVVAAGSNARSVRKALDLKIFFHTVVARRVIASIHRFGGAIAIQVVVGRSVFKPGMIQKGVLRSC